MASDDGIRPLGFSALVEEQDVQPVPEKKPPEVEEQPEEIRLLERSASPSPGPGLSDEERVSTSPHRLGMAASSCPRRDSKVWLLVAWYIL